jgi:serine/threonine protein kinase
MAEDKKGHEASATEGVSKQRETSSSAETELFIPSRDVSDVVLAESSTGAAPSFPVPSPPPTERGPRPQKPAPRDKAPLALLPGARVDDFEVVKLLGRGAFGHVYLARQLSLDRLVALKVSANRGSEGRTMARLEHQHIVQVFSEKVDPDFNQRLLCMQLVPGIGLEKLIGALHEAGSKNENAPGSTPGTRWVARSPDWTGAELLAIIDRSTSLPAALDPSALHDREALARMDAVEATAWFGGRLAEALDFAHHHGVLHRDIKPANILVNSYGRPLLADFNISSQPVGSEPSGDEMFGGTFAYMAPEHLDAFNPADATGPDAVTERSDLYSLGLVLQQLLDGRFSVPMAARKSEMVERLRALADERRSQGPTVPAGPPGARKTLERSIARCLEPHPTDRFASGAELAEQLDGCRRLRQAERQLPPVPAILSPILRRPFLWLIVAILLPHLAGSVVNIVYNATQIVGQLDANQRRLFGQLVISYNAVVYPILIVVLVLIIRPVWKCWNCLARGESPADEEVEAARRKALRLPRWIAALTALGWFPGGVLFPLAIDSQADGLNAGIFLHFITSFCLSGLIALAYSLCGAQFIVLRVLYPGMWSDARGFRETAQRELAPMAARLGRIQLLAGSIPLIAAVLFLTAIRYELSQAMDDQTRRHLIYLVYLAAGLIILGLFGYHIASAVIRGLSKLVVALTSTKKPNVPA